MKQNLKKYRTNNESNYLKVIIILFLFSSCSYQYNHYVLDKNGDCIKEGVWYEVDNKYSTSINNYRQKTAIFLAILILISVNRGVVERGRYKNDTLVGVSYFKSPYNSKKQKILIVNGKGYSTQYSNYDVFPDTIKCYEKWIPAPGSFSNW